jgi:hypothetical protein
MAVVRGVSEKRTAFAGEQIAKNSVCFLFALMLLCFSKFSTGA